MGVIPPHLLDDWDRVQREDYAHQAKYTVAKLPCCGSGVQVEANIDQYVTCPNKDCPKARELGRPPRHHISWSLTSQKFTSEQPRLQL
jgi:hypothetical protein